MAFIQKQRVFFVATAGPSGRVNLSPKGMDTCRVLDPGRIIWLNVTGSGNETAAHLLQNSRMTLMFCAFEGSPMILRVYGQAKTILPGHPIWENLYASFPALPGARQIFDLEIDLVQTSCGMGVPSFDFQSERTALNEWAQKKGADGLQQYWLSRNQASLDGNEAPIPIS